MRAAPIVILAATAAVASAQVATWYWTVSDTGNGNGLIEPGESAVLTLWLAFEPRQDQLGGGFAQAGFYDILGNSAWAEGHVEERTQLLPYSTSDGVLDEENNILGLDHFQFPWVFDGYFRSENPIDMFIIRWAPVTYAHRTVSLDNGAPVANIYTDAFGATILYSGTGGSVTFHVVPAPASAAAFVLCALAASRRRR